MQQLLIKIASAMALALSIFCSPFAFAGDSLHLVCATAGKIPELNNAQIDFSNVRSPDVQYSIDVISLVYQGAGFRGDFLQLDSPEKGSIVVRSRQNVEQILFSGTFAVEARPIGLTLIGELKAGPNWEHIVVTLDCQNISQ